jgi:GDP-L-fucose synthase
VVVLHVDALVDACVRLMNHCDESDIINIGVGQDMSIKELADVIDKIVGYEGHIKFDRPKSDGTPRKLLAVRKLRVLGWNSKIPLKDGSSKLMNGIRKTFK